jgi:16S rRNA processing protein RimM
VLLEDGRSSNVSKREPFALSEPKAESSTNKEASNATREWLAVATLLRPQGRKGELLAEPLTDLEEMFSAGREVVLAAAGATPPVGAATRKIEEQWFPTGKNAGRIVLKLSGCESINDAELLAGLQVVVPAEELPTLDGDTFFVGDLVGCAFFDGTTQAGTIVDVEFPTGPDGRTRLEDAAPLLAVELSGGGEQEAVLVPFVRAWLESVDIAARRVVMHLPEGLLGGLDDGEAEASDEASDDDREDDE